MQVIVSTEVVGIQFPFKINTHKKMSGFKGLALVNSKKYGSGVNGISKSDSGEPGELLVKVPGKAWNSCRENCWCRKRAKSCLSDIVHLQ